MEGKSLLACLSKFVVLQEVEQLHKPACVLQIMAKEFFNAELDCILQNMPFMYFASSCILFRRNQFLLRQLSSSEMGAVFDCSYYRVMEHNVESRTYGKKIVWALLYV